MINNGKDFILLDIETTGLSPYSEEITEIGALLVDGKSLEVKDKFHSLIRISKPVPAFIERLTGINDSMLQVYGKDPKDVLENFSKFCNNLICFAHNSNFDKGFLRTHLVRNEVSFIETEWVDTISIFKQKFPGRKTYKLESLMIDYGLANKENHRAIDDAMMTLKLLKL